ncbi:inosine 5'-monophosphate dehydrogenase [Maioricimonas rarisocia]|uniref:Inosine 5'-monophosphate dehydrogenase n=1 Tax=Maioricimonas rarisocia TaxID=2528026 RepID=A0A517ZC27_9PLAN|nr:CBS domain-containing protein [Maioricimonas rarisocia]QDU40005.1 inosine 5'-monophosphate dehydrogenase [Maioricimonas rarisocia]
MNEPQKSGLPGNDFQDPLEDYEPPEYSDPVEQALGEETVSSMKVTPYTSIAPDTTIGDAIQQMAGMHHACLLVADGDRLVGIFTDREIVDRVALEYDDMVSRPVRDVMTTDPVYVHGEDTLAAAMCVMAVSGFRHVPVLTEDGRIEGIVSPQRVSEYLHSRTGVL